MDTLKRITRRPVSTAIWTAALTLAALILGVAASLYASARAVPSALDSRGKTIAIQKAPMDAKDENGNYSFQPQFALLYDEDIEYLRSLPQVTGIDFRYLSGAYIEGVTAKLGLVDFFDMKEDISHAVGDNLNAGIKNVVLIGTVEDSFTLPFSSTTHYDLTAFGGVEDVGERYNCAVFRVEEAVVLHPDYPLFQRYIGDRFYDGRVNLIIPVFDEGSPCFFKKGVRYAVQGAYDPANMGPGDWPEGKPLLANVGFPDSSFMFSSFNEGDELVAYRSIEYDTPISFEDDVIEILNMVLTARDKRTIVAEEWSGTAEDLINDEKWSELIKQYSMALNSFPVLGTNDLESMYSFMRNEAVIVKGRSFTEEEYAAGAKVIVMDEGVAENAGLSVGSTVRLKQFQPAVDASEGNYSLMTGYYSLGGEYNNPTLGGSVFYHGLPEGDFEEFTIVGLYRMENEWKDSTCSFTPNTVFMPRGAQTDKAYGGPSRKIGVKEIHTKLPDGSDAIYADPIIEAGGVNGVYMSIILKNGSIDDFLQRIQDDTEFEYLENVGIKRYTKGLGGHVILCFDRGFDSMKDSVKSMIASAGKLALLMAAGAAVIFAMYVLIHQSTERKIVGIMRSLGAEPKTARRYLFGSGLVLAAAGAVIGTLLAYFFAGVLTDKLIGAALGDGPGIFAEIMRESAVPAWVYGALVLAETMLAAAVLFIHASRLSKKNPRKLLGK